MEKLLMADYYLDTMDYGDEENYPYPYKMDRGPGKCPICGDFTFKRKGKFGSFYGCSKYPICKGSRCFDE